MYEYFKKVPNGTVPNVPKKVPNGTVPNVPIYSW